MVRQVDAEKGLAWRRSGIQVQRPGDWLQGFVRKTAEAHVDALMSFSGQDGEENWKKGWI
jgi:hypothetical protein